MPRPEHRQQVHGVLPREPHRCASGGIPMTGAWGASARNAWVAQTAQRVAREGAGVARAVAGCDRANEEPPQQVHGVLPRKPLDGAAGGLPTGARGASPEFAGPAQKIHRGARGDRRPAPPCHGRACPGHPRLPCRPAAPPFHVATGFVRATVPRLPDGGAPAAGGAAPSRRPPAPRHPPSAPPPGLRQQVRGVLPAHGSKPRRYRVPPSGA